MTVDNEAIKNRVRKLLNLANDSAAFEGEIDNAVRAARRLMIEHNITEADLQGPGSDERTTYGQAKSWTYGANFSLWESWLVQALVLLFGTIKHYRTPDTEIRRSPEGILLRDIYGARWKSTIHFFYGPEEDARQASELFLKWSHVIAAMARLKYGGCFKGDGRSYAEGFASALYHKMKTIQAEEVKALETESTSRALVVRGAMSLMEAKKRRAAEWLEKEQGVKLQKTSGYQNKNNENAFGAGHADGRKAEFSRSKNLKIGRG